MAIGGGTVKVNRTAVVLIVFGLCAALYIFGPGSPSSSSNLAKSNYPQKVSIKELISVCLEVAKRGGLEVKRIRNEADIGEKSKGKTEEGANNPVTDGDMLSHRAMYYGILKAFPQLSVISEEHDPQPIDMKTIEPVSLRNPEVSAVIPSKDDELVDIKDVDVWIDPLDATQEYTEHLLHFVTTMVCVAVKGVPVAGVIHKPFEGGVNGTSIWAWNSNSGAFLGPVVEAEAKKNVKKEKDLSKSRIIVSRSHAGSVHEVAESAFGAESVVTPAGGAGYKSWEVIKGEQDVYTHVTLIKKWDICAPNAILNALGGQLTTLTGDAIDYSGNPADEKNRGGVVATMHDHEAYVDALEHVKVDLRPKSKVGRR